MDKVSEKEVNVQLVARPLSISLTVKDLQNSMKWYTEVLGFTVDRKIERDGTIRGYALKAGDARISINRDDGAKGWDRIKGLGFSLGISTDQSVDELAERIKDYGWKLDMEPKDMSWGARAIRVFDPDGFKITIQKPQPK